MNWFQPQKQKVVIRAKRPLLQMLSWSVIAALVIAANVTYAGTLQGLVVGKSGARMANVRIDYSGPSKGTTVTDNRGKFRIIAPGGSYTFRFAASGNRQDLQVNIPNLDKKKVKFTLNW